MIVEIRTQAIELTEAMRAHINDKIDVLKKYPFIDESMKFHVDIHKYNVGIKVVINGQVKGNHHIKSEVQNEDYYKAVDLCIHKIEDQLRRIKTKVLKNK